LLARTNRLAVRPSSGRVMEQLIFIAVIVVFSVIDAISKNRKAKQDQIEVVLQRQGVIDAISKNRKAKQGGEGPSLPEGSGDTSFRPIDRPIEIEPVLTRSTQPSSAVPIRSPRPSSTRPARLATEPAEHVIHHARRGYDTDPSSRTPSEQDGLDPLAVTLSQDVRSVRQRLLNQDAHALRQAIVLQEVLGPPAALREKRFQD
jgi:hypothetical protein